MPGDEVCVTIATPDDDVAMATREGSIHLNHGSGDTDSSAFTVILHKNRQSVAVVDNDGPVLSALLCGVLFGSRGGGVSLTNRPVTCTRCR